MKLDAFCNVKVNLCSCERQKKKSLYHTYYTSYIITTKINVNDSVFDAVKDYSFLSIAGRGCGNETMADNDIDAV